MQFSCLIFMVVIIGTPKYCSSQRVWNRIIVPDAISCSLPQCDLLCETLEDSGGICPRCASSNVANTGKLPGAQSCYNSAPGWIPGPRATSSDPSGCGPCLLSSEVAVCNDKSNPQANRGYYAGGPVARHGHSAIIFEAPFDSEYTGATLMIVFGGKDSDGNFLNDVWAYCVSECPQISFQKTVFNSAKQKTEFIAVCPNCRWRELSINQNFTDWITWKNITRAAVGQGNLPSRPAGRMGHTAAYGTAVLNYKTNVAVMSVFGGQGPNCSDYCPDMWNYDILANTWYLIYGEFFDIGSQKTVPTFDFSFYASSAPSKRWGHGAAVVGDDLYIFGGHTEGQQYACCGYDLNLCKSLATVNSSGGLSYTGRVGSACPFLQDLWVTSLQGYQPFFGQLAVGKHCTQSSTLGDGVARLAVDGSSSSGTAYTLTNTDSQAWWQVDLGSICNISNVTIFNRVDTDGERLQNFFVLISPVPLVSDRLQDVLLDPIVWNSHIMYLEGTTIAVQAQTIGQYVRIQLSGTDYLSLLEVQVWGYPLIEEWQHLYGTKRWTQLRPSPVPAALPRSDHTLSPVYPQPDVSGLVLFGGRTKESPFFLDELWLITLGEYETMARDGVLWDRLEPDIPGQGVTGSSSSISGPLGRFRHAAAVSQHCSIGAAAEKGYTGADKGLYPGVLGKTEWCSGFIFIYGGSTEASQARNHPAFPSGFLGDMWLYNVSSNVMTPINYTTSVPYPPRRSGHTMLAHDDMLIIYGGRGDPSECDRGVCGDAWWVAASGPEACPSNCSGHGACEFGFCVCELGFLGSTCDGQACPETDCTFDYGLHLASCRFCSGHGTCMANGSCACGIGWGGASCGSLNCPGQCSGHGTCKLGGRCDCDTGFGGEDCFIAQCPKNCTFWSDRISSGTQGDCIVLRNPPCCSVEPECVRTVDSPAVCVTRPSRDGEALKHSVSATCVCADSYTGLDCSQTVADEVITDFVGVS